jgi:hypothetical protein
MFAPQSSRIRTPGDDRDDLRRSPTQKVDVDQEGAAGNDVGSFAAREAPRGTFATGDRSHGPHRCHSRGTREHTPRSGHHRGPRLIAHDKPGTILMGKDANRNRL